MPRSSLNPDACKCASQTRAFDENRQPASQPAPACTFYEIVLSRLRKIRNISSGVTPILRVPSVRTGKSEAFASGSLYKICRTRHAETFAIGNEKVRTGSSAEIQFRYRTTIYSDILPLENRSYMNQEKERNEFIFRPFPSLFLLKLLLFSLWEHFLSLKKITHNERDIYKRTC